MFYPMVAVIWSVKHVTCETHHLLHQNKVPLEAQLLNPSLNSSLRLQHPHIVHIHEGYHKWAPSHKGVVLIRGFITGQRWKVGFHPCALTNACIHGLTFQPDEASLVTWSNFTALCAHKHPKTVENTKSAHLKCKTNAVVGGYGAGSGSLSPPARWWNDLSVLFWP